MGKTRTRNAGDNPVTKAEYERITQSQRNLHDLLPIIDSAEKCGIPCDEFRQVHQYLTDNYNALIREFCTPPPG